MRKTLIIIALLLTTHFSFSQGLRMGLTASPQISWLKSDAGSVSSDGQKFGFNFGLNADIFFAERYSLSTGLFINNTGGSLHYADSLAFETSDKNYMLAPGTTIDYSMQYLDIPLSFRLESNQIGYFVYYAQFGVTNHLRVGASVNIDTESINGAGASNEINFYSVGYNIGGGASYYFSKNTAFTFGIIYNNGFLDITSNDNKGNSDSATLRSTMLKLGIIF